MAATAAGAADGDDPSAAATLEKFRLYETRARFYLIGSSREKRWFRVLKIDRSEPSELNVSEDPVWYSLQEVKSLLQRIDEGNRATGGLTFVTKAYGIAGCIKFLESYYLILVTKRRQIGCICGHAIYCIDESQMITIPHSSVQTDVATSKNELRYKKLLASVDLTKDFFYSYTYPIMQSLQQNVTSAGMKEMPYENLFVWNTFLTEPVRSRCHNTLWTVALVHGHFKQVKLSIFGREINVVLISRRSRHFAGTRYLKRGVNDHGKVANDVETEQIVFEEEAGSYKGRMSAVVQMRGSIPLFWSQEASRLSPKPDIFVQRYDPTYEATKLHFDDLAQRYGHPIIILNLIKTVEKRPREMMLRREYFNAVGYLNQNLTEEKKLRFIHWDFHKFAKSKSANVLGVLGGVAGEALDLIGFYYSGKPKVQKRRTTQLSRTNTARDGSLDLRASSGDLSRLSSNADALCSTAFQDMRNDSNRQELFDDTPCYQTGVLRTNCIDCLDRTNVAQYAYGLAALGRQLNAMGLTDVPKIHPDSSIASALMEMYQSMGDALAHQYGGSAAHNTVFTERQGKWKATTQSREFLKSIKRYYSNAYTDGEKQDAINLFLGYFQPQEGKPALWELDTDYYLHVTTAADLTSDSYHLSSALGNNVFAGSGAASNPGATLSPVPACKEDFSKIKYTSFDKLIERTCSMIKNVRLHCDSDLRPIGGVGTSGMAPDAAEIQLKSPNWLFGQRKHTGTMASTKVTPVENRNEGNNDDSNVSIYGELNWLSSSSDSCEEDIFRRYLAFTTADVENGWYGGTLIYDQDENSGAYRHYSELCQGAVMDPFEHDPEKERHYAEALSVDIDITNDARIEAEMQAALDEYQIIGSDLSIIPSCGALAEDPSELTRWIIGDKKLLLACGVCHSDLHVLKGEIPFSSPCVVGHEITGEVVDHGANTQVEITKRFPVGSHVVGAFIMPCGNCFYCVKGQEDLCESFFAYNRAKGTLYDGETRLFLRGNGRPVYMYSMGGLAEYCVVPANALAVLPSTLPYTESAILGCAVFTAYGALRHAAEMRAGDSVAVIGVGGVGSSCLQIAKAFGASEVIAVDVLDEKLQSARTLGATHTVNAAKEDAVERIKELTDGRGVDVAVEALGKALTFSQCAKSVRDGGKAVMIGLAATNVVGEVDITRLVRRQVKIIGSYGARARQDLPQIVKLAESGAFNLQNTISRKCKFEEANSAYDDLNQGKIVGRAVVEIM